MKNLERWRNARAQRLKRQQNWSYREGRSKVQLEETAKKREVEKEKAKLLRKQQSPKNQLIQAQKLVLELLAVKIIFNNFFDFF